MADPGNCLTRGGGAHVLNVKFSMKCIIRVNMFLAVDVSGGSRKLLNKWRGCACVKYEIWCEMYNQS